MIDGLFDLKFKDGMKVSITKNEIYNQLLMYMFFAFKKNIIIVTPTLTEANELYMSLKHYLKDNVYIFPDDDYLTKKAIASSPELMYMRMKFLNQVDLSTNNIIICHTSSFLKRLPSKEKLNKNKIQLFVQSNINRDDLINSLISSGYKKESLVTNTGEFSVRGFIIDIFPIFEDHPVRIEFFDDVIENIKVFDENTQLSINNVEEIIVKPLNDEIIGHDYNIISYVEDGIVIYQDYSQIENFYKSIEEQVSYYNDEANILSLNNLIQHNKIFINTIDNKDCDYTYESSSVINYNNDVEKFINDLNKNNLVLCSNDKKFINKFNITSNKILSCDLLNGFVYKNTTYLSKNDLYPADKKLKYDTGYKMGKKINSIDKLEVGDYVVHKNSGIGVYMGITTISKNGVLKDYILIKYKGDDKLYLPVDKVESLYKYSSKDGAKPTIHKLNSSEWQKTKMKIRNKIKDISNELIKIYKNRNVSTVIPFLKDTPEQDIFESEFIYDETADQLKTVAEIKRDLEGNKPMDRLLCGDVGYGKTEVIFRAMFKTIMNNKQVMYLCPTTLLSYQQYMSAKSRFKNHAISIGLLNRYTSKKEALDVVEKLKNGQIDIVFGTHRLLSSDINFKDLGLLVIDEEQRFGVMHKEKIKEIKSNVHVLSVSATPIPRSLQMSLIGIRDLSLIETPPKNKFPVQTYVINYDPYVLRDIILKEKARKGQVFILYNNVENMQNQVNSFKKLLPELSIRFAHGKIDKEEMQDIMYEFSEGNFDVLVCTTIIENGIDIPNANTIIVMDADRFGLSQLYQIRGRVGRGDRQAYAYLMYDKNKILGEIAQKRLNAIKEFTELGSGYKIAMRDLSIRGAGDLLGSEQAGFIDSVGVDMYIQLINEELNGITEENENLNTNIDDVSTHIGESYSDEDEIIIDIHKMIAKISSIKEFNDVYESIKDRFGIVNDNLLIYMKQELSEKLIDKLNIKVFQNDKTKFTLVINNDVYSKINVENLFIETTKISTKFNFNYRDNKIYISLNKINLENNYVNYILDLLLYLDNEIKK